MKNALPYIFLTKMCKAHGIACYSMSKVDICNRLMTFYFEDPASRVPDYVHAEYLVGEWHEAKDKDAELASAVTLLVADHLILHPAPVVNDEDDDDSSSNSNNLSVHDLSQTTTINKFPMLMLSVAFHAKKLQLYPETDTLFVCKHKFTTDFLDQALAKFDTSPWANQPIGQETQAIVRRQTACGLHLFVFLLVDDKFFDRLINESAAGPLTRGDLDVSAVGDNSNFWVDICTAFKDNAYPMPPLPTFY
jgi:hypothetical protein